MVDYARIFSLSPNPYVLLDPDLVMVEVNEAYCAATMRGRDELVGRGMFDVFPSDPASPHGRQLRESFRRVLETRSRDELPLIRYAIPRADGSMEDRTWSATHMPLLGDDGRVRFILQHTVDITELHNLRQFARENRAGRALPEQAEMGVLDRAEQVQAKSAALSGQVRRLLELFEQAPGFMAVLSGPDHVFELANAAYRTLIGDRDPVGLSLLEALPEVADQHFVRLLDTVRASGEAYVGLDETALLSRGGRMERRRVDFVYQPIKDEGGEVRGVFVQGHDVTEKAQAEEALRAEMSALDALNRSAARVAAELDISALVQAVTDTGIEVTGADVGSFFYNVDSGEDGRYMLFGLSGEDRTAIERFGIPHDTDVFSPAFLGSGTVRSDDILADPGYAPGNAGAAMPRSSRPVRSYLAVPVRSRSGKVIGGLFFGHPEPGRFSDRMERVVEGLSTQAAIAFENASLFQAAQTEIEQRRRAEVELRQLNDRLERTVQERTEELRRQGLALLQAQKMEAIGKLTGGVAHDFNNLLQVIAGNLHLLARDLADDDRATARLNNALSGVTRGAKLASHLLAFGRRQSLEPKVINPGRFVQGMGDLLRRALGEEVELETIVGAGLWNTLADPTQVETALLNLAINARDAMEGRGRLTIEAANADCSVDCPDADVTPGQYVMLAVSDTGSGIPPDLIERVFEPFFTTKPDGKGSGLGLSMVYGFIKQSGGHVALASEVGRGTTVKLYLPRSVEPEDVEVDTDAGPATGGTETILVVEDDDEVRGTVVAMLEDLGYAVLQARDASAGLAIVESGAEIDLLFTDVVMPGPFRSPELAARARQRLPSIAVLFTSGYAESAIVHGGRLDPGVELLGKPYSRTALARRIRQVLRARPAPAPAPRPIAGAAPARTSANKDPIMPETIPERAAGPDGRRVLLVEDEPLIRLNAADMLAELGYEVEEAGSVREALKVMDERGGFEVLLADIGLPDGSGLDLAVEARARMPDLVVVLATGHSTVPGAAERLPGHKVLPKPYDLRQMRRSLEAQMAE